MEAIILAGGFGTRLQPVVKDVPKPMADIHGRPFLAYLIEYLHRYDVGRVHLSVGYKYEAIKNYFGSTYKHMDIRYVVESEPLGTGGAIREALKGTSEEDIFVLNGDTFFDVDLKKMLQYHRTEGPVLTLAVRPMRNFDRYGSVILCENRIIGFEEKVFKTSGYINGGVYVIQRELLNNVRQKIINFESDFLMKAVASSKIQAFVSDTYFIDIGVPEDYERARKELVGVFQGALK